MQQFSEVQKKAEVSNNKAICLADASLRGRLRSRSGVFPMGSTLAEAANDAEPIKVSDSEAFSSAALTAFTRNLIFDQIRETGNFFSLLSADMSEELQACYQKAFDEACGLGTTYFYHHQQEFVWSDSLFQTESLMRPYDSYVKRSVSDRAAKLGIPMLRSMTRHLRSSAMVEVDLGFCVASVAAELLDDSQVVVKYSDSSDGACSWALADPRRAGAVDPLALLTEENQVEVFHIAAKNFINTGNDIVVPDMRRSVCTLASVLGLQVVMDKKFLLRIGEEHTLLKPPSAENPQLIFVDRPPSDVTRRVSLAWAHHSIDWERHIASTA